MITGALMSILGWVVSLLPSWSPLAFIPDYIYDLRTFAVVDDALGFLAWADHYIPVSHLWYILSLAITIMIASQVYNAVMWVWHNLPGKAT